MHDIVCLFFPLPQKLSRRTETAHHSRSEPSLPHLLPQRTFSFDSMKWRCGSREVLQLMRMYESRRFGDHYLLIGTANIKLQEDGYPRTYGESLSVVELHVWHEGSNVRERSNGGGKIQSNEGGF